MVSGGVRDVVGQNGGTCERYRGRETKQNGGRRCIITSLVTTLNTIETHRRLQRLELDLAQGAHLCTGTLFIDQTILARMISQRLDCQQQVPARRAADAPQHFV